MISKQQFYNKGNIGKDLKLKTKSWSYKNTTHLSLTTRLSLHLMHLKTIFKKLA